MDMKKGYGNPLESMVKNDSYNQEIAQKLDSSLQKITENIFGGDVYSIGSSASGTHVQNEYGMADDVDFSVEGNNSSISELVSKLNDYKDEVIDTVKEYMPLKNPKLKIEETKEEGNYKQIRAKIEDGVKNVLGLDFNYNTNVSNYRARFHEQLDNIVANMDDKRAGQDYIKSQIREMKKYLKDNDVYKAKEGGLRGIGVEQLMVNLANKSYDNMEGLKQDVNVGNALNKVNDEKYNLNIQHPNTKENLAENLKNKGEGYQKGWDKILKAAENYKQYKPAESVLSRIKDGVKKYSEKIQPPVSYTPGPAY